MLSEAEQRVVKQELQRRVDALNPGGQSKLAKAIRYPQPQISAVLGGRTAPTEGLRDRLAGKVPTPSAGQKPKAASPEVSLLKPPPPRLVPSRSNGQTSKMTADELLLFLKTHGRADITQEIYTWLDELQSTLAAMRQQRP